MDDVAATLFGLIALALAVAAALAVARQLTERAFAAAIVAAAALVAIARALVVTPTFLHANRHGGPIVEAILGAPSSAMERVKTFGRFGFLALGAIAALLGRRFEVVCAANECFAAATLVLIAWTAYRWSGSRWAAAFTLAAAALYVPIVRVAVSEDAHTLALLLGWLAIVSLDVHARTRDRAALVAATLALLLMIHTRQTLYVFVPCAYALAWTRAGRAARLELYASAGFVTAVVASRASVTFGTSSEQTSFVMIVRLFSIPRLMLTALVHHPLFDVVRFGPALTLLFAAGALWALRHGGAARVALGGFALCFVVSLPTAWHTPGVELAFRLPALTLALALAGCGGARLVAHLHDRRLRLACLTAVLLAPLAGRAFGELRRPSADFVEYRFLRALAPTLPRELALQTLPVDRSAPSYRFPVGLLERAGIHVLAPQPGSTTPTFFFAGIQCWGWSMGELIRLGDDPLRLMGPALTDLGVAAVQGDLAHAQPPARMRPECARLMARSRPFGRTGAIVAPTQDPPFVLYGVDPIPLELRRIEPSPP